MRPGLGMIKEMMRYPKYTEKCTKTINLIFFDILIAKSRKIIYSR